MPNLKALKRLLTSGQKDITAVCLLSARTPERMRDGMKCLNYLGSRSSSANRCESDLGQ